MYWRRKLTRLELSLYVIIVSIVIGVFLERALYYMELSERAAVEATIVNANSAIAVHAAQALLTGMVLKPGLNPFDLMTPPANYLGEVAHPSLESMPLGSWAFDSSARQLVYRARFRRFLDTDTLRFEVRRGAISLKLAPANRFEWGA